MTFIIDEFHEKLKKYIDDDELVISLHELVDDEKVQKKLIRLLAKGWKASIEYDEDQSISDGEYIFLTKGEENQTLLKPETDN